MRLVCTMPAFHAGPDLPLICTNQEMLSANTGARPPARHACVGSATHLQRGLLGLAKRDDFQVGVHVVGYGMEVDVILDEVAHLVVVEVVVPLLPLLLARGHARAQRGDPQRPPLQRLAHAHRQLIALRRITPSPCGAAQLLHQLCRVDELAQLPLLSKNSSAAAHQLFNRYAMQTLRTPAPETFCRLAQPLAGHLPLCCLSRESHVHLAGLFSC